MVPEPTLWISWWDEADLIIKSIFIFLAALSLLSWTVIIYKTLQFFQFGRWENSVVQHLNNNHSQQSPLPTAVSLSLANRLRQNRAEQYDAERDDGLIRQRLTLENQLTILATIGNTAPFIGLLGTVWGIMLALQKMGGTSGISLDTVAGPVGEALAVTAMGLFVAIPAVAGYNLLIRRLRKLLVLIELNTKALLATETLTVNKQEGNA